MSARLRLHRLLPLAALAALLGVLGVLAMVGGPAMAATAVSHAPIKGSGSSWASNAIAQWQADVVTNGDLHVDFNPNGAALGRSDFANDLTDFGVSDIGYQGSAENDTSQGRAYAYLPIAAGGTALPYNIQVGGQQYRNLRLSGETVAKIFTGQITNWDDPAVTKDNNGHALPSIPIIPVVHSEGAGVSYEFSLYLSKEFPSIWKACNGTATPTEYFPANCGKSSGPMKAFSGSDGVMNFLTSSGANGAIATDEYSYPLAKNYPSAKLLNAAGYYTLPTQYNVAVALTKAVINTDKSSPNYLLQTLDHVYTNPDKRTYPLSSYVYAIIPTAANDPKTSTVPARQTVADFLYYGICAGQAEIGPIGYSSLPYNLVTAGFGQIDKLPGIVTSGRNPSTCNNPTFDKSNLKKNLLAEIAPQPAACDKTGAGPCTGLEGTANANPTGGKAPSNTSTTPTSGSTASTTGTTSTTTPTDGSTVPGVVPGAGTPSIAAGGAGSDLGLGATTGTTGTGAQSGADGTSGSQGSVVATTLSADDHAGPGGVLTGVVVGLFLLALLVPPLVSRLLSRRR